MDRGKRRSIGQRIGTKGEGLFKTWATDRHLSANKVDDDYGVDFFCQVFRSEGTHGCEESTGAVLAVKVRATEGESRPRVRLGRSDVVDLLRQTHAACLVGVHVKAGAVRFRFLDEKFIDELNAFLTSPNATLPVRLDQMESDVSVFDRMLAYHCRPGTVQQVTIYKTERRIAAAIPGSSISIHQGVAGGLALVDVPWFGSALQVDPAHRDVVRMLAFEQGRSPHDLPGIRLKPELVPVLDLADFAVVRGRIERDVKLTLKCGEEEASATFQLRVLDDETALTHPVGMTLVTSDRRKKEDVWVHEFEWRIFVSPLSLGKAGDVLPFLRLLRTGAHCSVEGRPFSPIEDWGESITGIGPEVTALERITAELKLDLNDFHLGDFREEDFGRSVSFLDAFMIQGEPLECIANPLIVGPTAEKEPADIPTESVLMHIPVVLNLREKGVILWVRARGAVYLSDEGEVCGLRIEEQQDWCPELHERFDKSVYPELWVRKQWPAIPLGAYQPGIYTLKAEDAGQVTVEANVWKEEDPVESP